MLWLLAGLVVGSTLGMMLMAALSITRHRLTQAVADAAVAYVARRTCPGWHDLIEAVDRLMAE